MFVHAAPDARDVKAVIHHFTLILGIFQQLKANDFSDL
jgi:hypothetical protein